MYFGYEQKTNLTNHILKVVSTNCDKKSSTYSVYIQIPLNDHSVVFLEIIDNPFKVDRIRNQ